MITENGWPSCGPEALDLTPIPGTSEVVPLQNGQPNAILNAFMGDLNWYVEAAVDTRGGAQDEGGWTATNSVPTSNHLGGTAFDYNWNDHPMGVEYAGWDHSEIAGDQEIPRVRELLEYYEGTVFWANDWDSPKDSMHFQLGYQTYGNPHTQSFIDRKIRPDGFSRFKEERGAAVDVSAVLAEAMQPSQVSVRRFAELQAHVTRSLAACDCTTPERISMWCAQVGTESGGLRYQEEIADGSAYEGRADLGNTQPGDGTRYKGRDFIQITGRHNYTQLSVWAHENSLVDSPAFFADNPEALADDEYAFAGVTWYWVVARPTLNEAADNEDVVTATHLVNGGEHGLRDRQDRYTRCRRMGERILALVSQQGDSAMLINGPSRSIYRDDDDDIGPGTEVDFQTNGMTHEARVEQLAMIGEQASLDKVKRVADGEAPVEVPDWAQERAQAILNAIGKRKG